VVGRDGWECARACVRSGRVDGWGGVWVVCVCVGGGGSPTGSLTLPHPCCTEMPNSDEQRDLVVEYPVFVLLSLDPP
jgi:hypothetical protein